MDMNLDSVQQNPSRTTMKYYDTQILTDDCILKNLIAKMKKPLFEPVDASGRCSEEPHFESASTDCGVTKNAWLPTPLLPRRLYSPSFCSRDSLWEHADGRVSNSFRATVGKRTGSLIEDGLGRSIASISPGGMLQPPPRLEVPMFGFHH